MSMPTQIKSLTLRFNFRNIPALAAIIGPIVFWLLIFVVENLQPSYNPINETISSLVYAQHGWIQTMDFFLMGTLMIAFSIGLNFFVKKTQGLKFAILLFIMVGIGVLFIGICPTDQSALTKTITGWIHQITVHASGFFFPIACFLITPSMKADPNWKKLAQYNTFAGIMVLVLGVGWAVGAASGWIDAYIGLYERIFMANALIWLEVMGIRALVLSRNWDSLKKKGQVLAHKLNSEPDSGSNDTILAISRYAGIGTILVIAAFVHNYRSRRSGGTIVKKAGSLQRA